MKIKLTVRVRKALALEIYSGMFFCSLTSKATVVGFD